MPSGKLNSNAKKNSSEERHFGSCIQNRSAGKQLSGNMGKGKTKVVVPSARNNPNNNNKTSNTKRDFGSVRKKLHVENRHYEEEEDDEDYEDDRVGIGQTPTNDDDDLEDEEDSNSSVLLNNDEVELQANSSKRSHEDVAGNVGVSRTSSSHNVPTEQILVKRRKDASTGQRSATTTYFNGTPLDSFEMSSEVQNSEVLTTSTGVSLARFEKLEDEVKQLRTQISMLLNARTRYDSGTGEVSIKLPAHFVPFIGTMVRDQLWKICKYLDSTAVASLGQDFYQKTIRTFGAEMEDKIHDLVYYKAFIAKAKHFLNVYKCHVKRKVRLETLGKIFLKTFLNLNRVNLTIDLCYLQQQAIFMKAEKKGEEFIFWFMYIYEFRQGNFKDVDEKCKLAWYLFCDKILVHVTRKWKQKGIREAKLVSEVCFVSDEAYAYEIGNTNMYFWMQQYYHFNKKKLPFEECFPTQPDGARVPETKVVEDEEEAQEEPQEDEKETPGETNNRNRKLEKLKGTVKSSGYYEFFKSLQKKKHEHADDWKSWDVGFRDYIQSNSRNASTKQVSPSTACDDEVEDTQMNEANEDIEFEPWDSQFI